MSEQDQFLKDLEKNAEGKADVLEQPLTETPAKTQDSDDPENQPESVKDRRHRRLEDKLTREREANIAMAARLEALAEAQRATSSTEEEYLKSVERIYGTETPEAVAATELLKNAIKGAKDSARQEALDALRAEREEASSALQDEETTLESMVENIEDEYGVTFTPEMERGYFTLMEKLSPKDAEGNVIEYADPDAVWEEYQSRIKRTDTKAKDLSSRSMSESGSSVAAEGKHDAIWDYLKKEQGW